MRLDKSGPDRAAQEAALRAAGLNDFGADGPVYVDLPPPKRIKPGVDPLPGRTLLLRALQGGDDVAIHSAARLGATRGDVLAVLGAIGEAGAAVWDCQAGEAVKPHPEALAMIRFAERAESQGQQERAAKARRNITHRAGPPAALTGKKLAAAKVAWGDPEKAARQVAEECGASVRTLYRLFGPKGTPVFGRKEKP